MCFNSSGFTRRAKNAPVNDLHTERKCDPNLLSCMITHDTPVDCFI